MSGPLKSILRDPNQTRTQSKRDKVVRVRESTDQSTDQSGEYFITTKDGTTTYYQEPDLALHSHWTTESRLTQLYPDSSSEDEIRILKENNNIHNKVKFCSKLSPSYIYR